MSSRLYFDLAAALRLAEHAIAAPRKQQSFTEAQRGIACTGALVWGNDHGVYLMSGGDPGLHIDPDNPDRGHVVVYAEGYRPRDERYDPNLGGDDFAEHLHLTDNATGPPLIESLRAASARGFRWLLLQVSKDTYSIGVA